MKLFDLLKIGAGSNLNKQVLVHGERQINYQQLIESSIGVASALEKLNLPSGARVALLYENSIEYVILLMAIFKAGQIAVPLDTSLKPERINLILRDCGAEVLIFHAKYQKYLDRITAESPVHYLLTNKELSIAQTGMKIDTLSDILKAEDKSQSSHDDIVDKPKPTLKKLYELAEKSSDKPAAIFYTSGSTGEPKGVTLSHRNLISNTIATVDYLKLTADDSIMVILPFYYIYGNSLLLTHLLVGGSLVIDNRFLYPEVILDNMEQSKVTGFSGVPSNFIILLNNSTLPERKLPHLRYFTQAGGAMAPEITRKLMSTFPEKEIYIMYGQTEAAPRITYCPPEKLQDKLGTIGLPLNGIQIKIIDEQGREKPPGESGELITTGDNVMLGYWNQPDETASVLKDGWLHTGDLAKKDDDGYYFITGRIKEIIKTGGNRVSAKEVEECLQENEKILEAAVFGIEDELLGEAVKAVVTLKEGQTADQKEIQQFCRKKLSEHKIPKIVEIIDRLPKYQSGKVNKMLLKK